MYPNDNALVRMHSRPHERLILEQGGPDYLCERDEDTRVQLRALTEHLKHEVNWTLEYVLEHKDDFDIVERIQLGWSLLRDLGKTFDDLVNLQTGLKNRVTYNKHARENEKVRETRVQLHERLQEAKRK